jgi:hypothetical protein
MWLADAQSEKTSLDSIGSKQVLNGRIGMTVNLCQFQTMGNLYNCVRKALTTITAKRPCQQQVRSPLPDTASKTSRTCGRFQHMLLFHSPSAATGEATPTVNSCSGPQDRRWTTSPDSCSSFHHPVDHFFLPLITYFSPMATRSSSRATRRETDPDTSSNRRIEYHLRMNALPLHFQGRWVVEWTESDLRRFLKLLDLGTQARSPSSDYKLRLCERLTRRAPPQLTAIQQEAIELIILGLPFRFTRAVMSYAYEAWERTPAPDDTELAEPRRDCIVCLAELPSSRFPAQPIENNCNHQFNNTCADCYVAHINGQMDTASLDQIRCPEPECRSVLSHSQMRLYASEDAFERYSNFINQRTLRNLPDYLDCANPGCENGGIVDHNAMGSVYLDACDSTTCITCGTIWRPGLSHEENQADEQRRRADDESLSLQSISRRAKRCPGDGCGVPIQKNRGCDHMTCMWHQWAPNDC